MNDPVRSALWVLRTLAWGCVLVLAVLSLLPAKDMPHTGWPDVLNHFIAYAGTAAITVPAYRKGRGSGWAIVAMLCIYAAILEYRQRFAPGRDPGVDDFIASSIGAICGGAAGALLWSHLLRPFFAVRGGNRRERLKLARQLPSTEYGSGPHGEGRFRTPWR